MKFILIACLVLLNAFYINAFLFGTKAPKDGCNPNPCKNKATCVKNPSAPLKQGTCVCLSGYYGPTCDKKDGCYSKPCKYGTCTVDSLNPGKFNCKCPVGQVGEKCEKADECAKNPCQNGGTCKLDAKLRAVCTCANGWSSTKCDKRNCTIVEFRGKHFGKLPKVYIDKAVEPKFLEFDEIAKKCKVIIQPSRSFSQDSKPIIQINDAGYVIGRALQFEVLDEKGKLLCNNICLSKSPVPQGAAKCFIDGVIAKGWKFNPVTSSIHDGTYQSNPQLYKVLRETAMVGCKDKNF